MVELTQYIVGRDIVSRTPGKDKESTLGNIETVVSSNIAATFFAAFVVAGSL